MIDQCNTHKLSPLDPPVVVNSEAAVIAGGCGELDAIHSFVEWVIKGGDYPSVCRERSDQCCFVVLTMNGELMTFERTNLPVTVGKHQQAYGSGSHFAMGAMANGATAKHAVEIASKLDPHTGGRVYTYEEPSE